MGFTEEDKKKCEWFVDLANKYMKDQRYHFVLEYGYDNNVVELVLWKSENTESNIAAMIERFVLKNKCEVFDRIISICEYHSLLGQKR